MAQQTTQTGTQARPQQRLQSRATGCQTRLLLRDQLAGPAPAAAYSRRARVQAVAEAHTPSIPTEGRSQVQRSRAQRSTAVEGCSSAGLKVRTGVEAEAGGNGRLDSKAA